MKNLWDERYRDSAYVYGTAPNVWLKEQLRDLTSGNHLRRQPGRISCQRQLHR